MFNSMLWWFLPYFQRLRRVYIPLSYIVIFFLNSLFDLFLFLLFFFSFLHFSSNSFSKLILNLMYFMNYHNQIRSFIEPFYDFFNRNFKWGTKLGRFHFVNPGFCCLRRTSFLIENLYKAVDFPHFFLIQKCFLCILLEILFKVFKQIIRYFQQRNRTMVSKKLIVFKNFLHKHREEYLKWDKWYQVD